MPEKASRLARRLKEDRLVVAPGVFELISAKIADRMGFDCLYVTGYGVAASHLGLPDAGIATYSDMVGRVAQIGSMTQTPFIADADTGYGGLLNVQHTVRGYEAAGACGIQLEDQESPKKCGIIARTDALTTLGLDEALRRADAYLKAGADVLFVESPETPEEMRKICEAFRGVPLVANMVQGGGRTPLLGFEELQNLGYRIAIYPAAGFLAMGAALEKVYAELKANKDISAPLYDFKQFSELMGFDWVAEFERKYRDAG